MKGTTVYYIFLIQWNNVAAVIPPCTVLCLHQIASCDLEKIILDEMDLIWRVMTAMKKVEVDGTYGEWWQLMKNSNNIHSIVC